jgi:transposase-like protein
MCETRSCAWKLKPSAPDLPSSGVSVLRTCTPRCSSLEPTLRYNFAVPMHHLAKPDLQSQILRMLREGMSQAAIARQLHKGTGTVSHHVRSLREAGLWKVPAREYLETAPERGGKRRCVGCGRTKSPGAFPNERSARCTVCVRARRTAG